MSNMKETFALVLYSYDELNPMALSDNQIFHKEKIDDGSLDSYLQNRLEQAFQSKRVFGWRCFFINPSTNTTFLYKEKFHEPKKVTILNPEKRKKSVKDVSNSIPQHVNLAAVAQQGVVLAGLTGTTAINWEEHPETWGSILDQDIDPPQF